MPTSDSELLSEVELIEAQPLADRAQAFEHLYEQLLTAVQMSDAETE